MGKRVHVAKTYKVEYGETEAFNWANYKFYEALQALGACVCGYGTEEDDLAGGFEVTDESYRKAVGYLEQYRDNPDVKFEDADADTEDIRQMLDSIGMTAEELLEIMKSYLSEADTHDGWLHFASW